MDDNPTLQELYRIVETTTDYRVRIDNLHEIARILRKRHDYKNGLHYLNAAQAEAIERNYGKGLVEAYISRGLFYYYEQEYESALKENLRAIELAEELNDLFSLYRAHNNLANVYSRIERYEESYRRHKIAAEYAEKLGNRRKQAISLNNMGIVLKKIGRLDQALHNFKDAIIIFREENADKLLAYAVANIGFVLVLKKAYEEAIPSFDRSLEIHGDADCELWIQTMAGKAEALAGLERYEEAIEMLHKARFRAEDLHVKFTLSRVYDALHEVYLKSGDYRNAYDYYHRYAMLQDMIINEKADTTLAELETRHELELKKKEAEITAFWTCVSPRPAN